mmetsp:Transcript_51252/g.108932  ORF Transcript_51252/g.108932 Transcript_51252/m.108932 type:complete len:300 (-) Transcript_51252:1013-1912(-)
MLSFILLSRASRSCLFISSCLVENIVTTSLLTSRTRMSPFCMMSFILLRSATVFASVWGSMWIAGKNISLRSGRRTKTPSGRYLEGLAETKPSANTRNVMSTEVLGISTLPFCFLVLAIVAAAAVARPRMASCSLALALAFAAMGTTLAAAMAFALASVLSLAFASALAAGVIAAGVPLMSASNNFTAGPDDQTFEGFHAAAYASAKCRCSSSSSSSRLFLSSLLLSAFPTMWPSSGQSQSSSASIVSTASFRDFGTFDVVNISMSFAQTWERSSSSSSSSSSNSTTSLLCFKGDLFCC